MTFTTDVQPCGTMAAWHRHYRAGETPCGACKKAKAEADRKRDLRKRGDYRKTRPKATPLPKPSKEMDALLEENPPVIPWRLGRGRNGWPIQVPVYIDDPHTDHPNRRKTA